MEEEFENEGFEEDDEEELDFFED